MVRHVFAVVPAAELILIDDGSRDATPDLACDHARQEPRIRVIRQPTACHGPALMHGLREARGSYCLLLDSDRQIGLQHFAESWALAQQCDAVLGVRRDRQDPRHRLVLSAAVRRLAAVLGIHAADAPTLLPARAPRPRPSGCRTHAAPGTDSVDPADGVSPATACRVIEQPVPHFARRAGVTTLNLKRLSVFCRKALIELFRFDRALSRAH
ncbi:MAG: glycosyltransferase [Uliginosibacterium sp.]|nr:glycosyltransferase [Uliginosibacterium sp.]